VEVTDTIYLVPLVIDVRHSSFLVSSPVVEFGGRAHNRQYENCKGSLSLHPSPRWTGSLLRPAAIGRGTMPNKDSGRFSFEVAYSATKIETLLAAVGRLLTANEALFELYVALHGPFACEVLSCELRESYKLERLAKLHD
jgi:hypothetical protein